MYQREECIQRYIFITIELGIPFYTADLDKVEHGAEIHDYVKKVSNEITVPNVFINGIHWGGWDDIEEAHKKNQLLDLCSK